MSRNIMHAGQESVEKGTGYFAWSNFAGLCLAGGRFDKVNLSAYVLAGFSQSLFLLNPFMQPDLYQGSSVHSYLPAYIILIHQRLGNRFPPSRE